MNEQVGEEAPSTHIQAAQPLQTLPSLIYDFNFVLVLSVFQAARRKTTYGGAYMGSL